MYKSPGSDQIPAALIQAGSEILRSEIHKLINSVWSKEELLDRRKESNIVPVHKKGDKTDGIYYRGISLLSNSHKFLFNILLSRLSPYVDEVVGNHQCGFRRNRSTTFHSSDTRDKKEYNETVQQLFIEFIKACDSIRREVLYNILIESGLTVKLVRLIKCA
jgi:hypothetical protein